MSASGSMFLREMLCSGRDRMRGATLPGEASTGAIIRRGSPAPPVGAHRAGARPAPPPAPRGSGRPRGRAPAAEGRQGARRVAHEGVALGPKRADEDELAPLELGDREAALDRHDVGEGILATRPSAGCLRPELAREVLEQLQLLRGEVDALDERAPVGEVRRRVRRAAGPRGASSPSRAARAGAPSGRGSRAPAACPRRDGRARSTS